MSATASTFAKTAVRVWGSGSDSPARTQRRGHVLLRFGVGVAVVIGIGALVSWPTVLRLLREVRLSYALPAAALLVPNLGLQYVKWAQLLRSARPDTRWSDAAASLLAGFALGLVTPGRLGEIGRGIFLSGHDKTQTTFLAAVDKVTTLGVILLAGVVSLAGLLAFRSEGIAGWPPAAIGLVVGAALLAGCFAPGWTGSLFGRLPLGRLHGWSSRFGTAAWTEASPRFRLGILGLSLAFHATFVLQFSLLVAAFTGKLTLTYPLAAATALFMKTLLPVSFGDLGVREGSAALVFSGIGVVPAAAFSGALLLFVINVVVPAVIGTVILLTRRHSGNSEPA